LALELVREFRSEGASLFGQSMCFSHLPLAAYKHWSKDLVFVFSDQGLSGMLAWLEAYHEKENPGLSAFQFPSKTKKKNTTTM